MDLIKKVVQKTWLAQVVVENIIKLLDEWNTIPFIARYRKELTQWATDEQLRDFHDIYTYTQSLEKRKEDVIRLIDEKWLLTPELKDEILKADSLARVEDLYRPFKEKKNSKATIAKAKWLQPLADLLKRAMLTKAEFDEEAKKYIKISDKKDEIVATYQEAIQWAKDIVAEEVSDDANLREKIKYTLQWTAFFCSKPTKTFEKEWVYKIYWDYKKKLIDIPSYAYLALNRAEEEKQLKLSFEYNLESFVEISSKIFVPKNPNSSVEYLLESIEDWLKRLLMPSIEREVRSDKKRRSDEAAIKVFGENMKNLLLTPPLRWKVVLWFDPAYRTGCKLAIVDETGKFLHNDVIYPTPPQSKIEEAEMKLLKMINNFKVNLIVIWNWTASRESEQFVSNFLKKFNMKEVAYMVVSEAGASVYSASKLAQEEYPTLDVTVRGAISIAHRVQDSLAELTKIDPKAIGVGQYQHDVDQNLLQKKLDEKVEDTVNNVWVDVNTASYALLQYVAGLSKTLAKNVVDYRNEHWKFESKTQIKKVKWMGPKAYEQCIGFLRIKWGKEILDMTWIHPENHKKVYEILDKEFGINKKSLKLPLSLESNKLRTISDKYEIWYETLVDIFADLARPWLDPRDDIPAPKFKSDVLDVKDLEIWMVLDWVIRNVTDFGAFVDIWLHNDWLVHKSEMADFFVSNPTEVVSVWMPVKVKVLTVDVQREKVWLSMKWINTLNNKQTNTSKPKFERKDNNSEESSIKWNITFF